MVKKVLSVAAAAAIAVTGASAFDIYDDGWNPGRQVPYRYNNTIPVSATTAPSFDATAPINVNNGVFNNFQGMFGDALLFPVYYAGNGWVTHLRVINTSSKHAVVAKVVLYAGSDSRELRDFNIYLSADDVWRGTIKVDEDGTVRLVSSDDSSPLENGGMASEANPMITKALEEPVGYVAVIGLAMTVEPHVGPTSDVYERKANADYIVPSIFNAADFKDERAHGDHAGLRAEYNSIVRQIRQMNQPVVFRSGVITSGTNVPNVDLAQAVTLNKNLPKDGKANYFFTGVDNVLTGDVRITDTVNGKDMVMPAIAIQNETQDTVTATAQIHQALLIAEGEKAHLADRALTGVDTLPNATTNNNALASEYDYPRVCNDATQFATRDVWVTYGDTANPKNNMVLVTSPYKRVLVEMDAQTLAPSSFVLDNGNCAIRTNPFSTNTRTLASVYRNVRTDGNANIVDWGYFSALTFIYDEHENVAGASQFSPATTPVINFHYEVSPTEGVAPKDTLSYYLEQVKNAGFDKGYVHLRYIGNGRQIWVPAVATQWLATDVAGKVITNWTMPAQK